MISNPNQLEPQKKLKFPWGILKDAVSVSRNITNPLPYATGYTCGRECGDIGATLLGVEVAEAHARARGRDDS
jgi:hypothetical protein